MEPKQTALFLLAGLVLAVAATYSLPMQHADACEHGCGDNGGGNYEEEDCDCNSGGSLVSVDNNNIGNNIGNIETGHILSGNEIKTLNDVNVLSKNYLKDVNVVSKNLDNVELDKVLYSNDVIDGDGLNGNSILVAFDELVGGH
jgi:hypothetical protein